SSTHSSCAYYRSALRLHTRCSISCTVPLSSLLSFPTRRSSDLTTASVQDTCLFEVIALTCESLGPAHRGVPSRPRRHPCRATPPAPKRSRTAPPNSAG